MSDSRDPFFIVQDEVQDTVSSNIFHAQNVMSRTVQTVFALCFAVEDPAV